MISTRVRIKDHVVGMIGGAILGEGCTVVEELVDARGVGFSGRGLLRDNFAEGVQDFFIDDAGIVEDLDENAWDAFDSGVI